MLFRLSLLSIFLISVRSDSIPIEHLIAVAEHNLQELQTQQMYQQEMKFKPCIIEDPSKLMSELVKEYGYGNFPQKDSDKLYDLCLKSLHCYLIGPYVRYHRQKFIFQGYPLLQDCTLARFRRGPYFKCIKKLELQPNEIKTRKHSGYRPRCELTDEEFWKLAETVNAKCDKDAWRDMMINRDLVKGHDCIDQSEIIKKIDVPPQINPEPVDSEQIDPEQ